jgi:cytochrome c peroxidase
MANANKRWRFLLGVLAALGAVTFARSQTPTVSSDNGECQWNLPKGFPKLKVPSDNPMTSAKVNVGALLFNDRRMSGNGSQSCGHLP